MSKYLIQRFTNKGYGRLWLATPQLASRPDFYEYPDNAPVPKNMIVQLATAPVIEPHKPALLMEFEKKTITEATQTAAAPDSTVTGLSPIDDEQAPDLDDTPAPAPVITAMSGEAKHEKLVAILKDEKTFPKDENHYTAKGTPRLDALIAVIGCDVQTQEMNAAVAAVSAGKPAESAKVELTPGQRMDAIMKAIPKLKAGDMTASKRNPHPRIDALKALTGIEDLNGVENEQAFAAFKKQNPDWKPLEA